MRCDIIIQFRHKLLEESVCDVSLGGRLALGEQYSRNSYRYCTEVSERPRGHSPGAARALGAEAKPPPACSLIRSSLARPTS